MLDQAHAHIETPTLAHSDPWHTHTHTPDMAHSEPRPVLRNVWFATLTNGQFLVLFHCKIQSFVCTIAQYAGLIQISTFLMNVRYISFSLG